MNFIDDLFGSLGSLIDVLPFQEFQAFLPLMVGFAFKLLFLLLIAGIAFSQLYRRPRSSWWLLSAIAITVGWECGLNLICSAIIMGVFAPLFVSGVGETLGTPLAMCFSFVPYLLVRGLTWWCLLQALFDSSASLPIEALSSTPNLETP